MTSEFVLQEKHLNGKSMHRVKKTDLVSPIALPMYKLRSNLFRWTQNMGNASHEVTFRLPFGLVLRPEGRSPANVVDWETRFVVGGGISGLVPSVLLCLAGTFKDELAKSGGNEDGHVKRRLLFCCARQSESDSITVTEGNRRKG